MTAWQVTGRLGTAVRSQPFVWLMVSVLAIFFVVQNLNGRFGAADLYVPYTATRQALSGGQVYYEPFGLASGNYKYSPSTLLLFLPLSIAPFWLAKTLHYVVNGALFVALTIFLERFVRQRLVGRPPPTGRRAFRRQLVLGLSSLVVVVHVQRELLLGNQNLLLLACAVFALDALVRGHECMAGAALAIAVLMKPHFAVLAPLLLVRRKQRALAALAATIGLGLIGPGIVWGWAANVQLHRDWLDTMVVHNQAWTAGVNTLPVMLWKCGISAVWPWRAATFPVTVVSLVAAVVFAWVRWHARRETPVGPDQPAHNRATAHLAWECFVVVALIPSLVFTDTEHFVWSLPLVLFLVTQLVDGQLSRPARVWSVGVLFLYGGNWFDVWGGTVSRWAEHAGLLGLANLLLLGTATWLFERSHGADRADDAEVAAVHPDAGATSVSEKAPDTGAFGARCFS